MYSPFHQVHPGYLFFQVFLQSPINNNRPLIHAWSDNGYYKTCIKGRYMHIVLEPGDQKWAWVPKGGTELGPMYT